MNCFLENLEALHSHDDKVVYKAILEKKDWMFRPLFLPGDLRITTDIEGKEHFPFIEALFNDTLLFTKYKLGENVITDPYIRQSINDFLGKRFRKIVFHGEIRKQETTPHFYVEYNFQRIDQKGYQTLVANFFPCIPELQIDLTKIEVSLTEQIKAGIVGKKGDFCFIMDESQLLNDAFWAPVMTRIIVHPLAPKEVKEILEQLSMEKEILYEEENYE